MDDNEVKVCKLRKRPNIYELFFKSLKFFVMINAVVLTIANLLKYTMGINPIMIFFMIGNYCAVQATYYKLRMSENPNYKPDCGCYDDSQKEPSFADDAMNGILTVLEHKKGTLFFNVPNSVFGIIFYTYLMLLTLFNIGLAIVKVLIVVSCLGSLFLWYIMVTEVKSICILCTTIHTVNFLSLYFLMF